LIELLKVNLRRRSSPRRRSSVVGNGNRRNNIKPCQPSTLFYSAPYPKDERGGKKEKLELVMILKVMYRGEKSAADDQ
jgi:hypothetical protein